ncbi:alpha/beta fold hydrolase [Geodermatophilus obscurus]|uniref:Alpha/beta hydrolase fold protein n=1 Tax=Geodermatophilus obscurus (strain ATCC 25078 / DSM 43160 / JCM 3152 / CCUG 61914 / KCC A-0152 / KCTC 9177 / NBRC 13315 / NRRL B-3577 / G-20) TaxID=526225 RepID=D2S8Y2_GEOOG|nr:alpha/beta hydrolase [Geodermatophilus obscurus]ADB73625.1 alpha/beta hydrolase fold protein [Geodermatophilus obscurus DSM 43160]
MTVSLSTTRTGSGEPLLLLHGMGSSRRDFTAVADLLAERFDVLNVDLPGVGRSPVLERRPTVAAITDAVERTLDAAGVGSVHVLGNSLGARVALELAVRGRARSVVAIAPSGLNVPRERAFQGTGMALARVVTRTTAPLVEPLSRSAPGRATLLAPLKARAWSTSPEEAIGAREGFADSRDFWRTLLWGLLLDVPRGLDRIDCPVTLVQGVADWVASGQTVRYLPLVPGSRFRPLLWAGHAPQSDRPRTIVRLVEEAARRAGQPADSSALRYEQRNRAPDIASVKSASQAGSSDAKAV